MLEVKCFESKSELKRSFPGKNERKKERKKEDDVGMCERFNNFPPKKQAGKKCTLGHNNWVFYLGFLIPASGKRLNWWGCKELLEWTQ